MRTTVGLVAAFLPAVMLLGIITLKPNIKQEALMAPCFISVVCCLASSIMLFSRKTVLAILFALLLLLLNGFIAFFFGCLATFKM